MCGRTVWDEPHDDKLERMTPNRTITKLKAKPDVVGSDLAGVASN